eukprot:13811-Rhodomonas_salina.8
MNGHSKHRFLHLMWRWDTAARRREAHARRDQPVLRLVSKRVRSQGYQRLRGAWSCLALRRGVGVTGGAAWAAAGVERVRETEGVGGAGGAGAPPHPRP